ncbi:MAG TPA: hypothetical protein VG873_12485 [Burkholderiales bacterium]|nr:hypothetical protein [Burkholderiales bacterium]
MSHDKTLKLVTNLDRAAIEARIAEVRKAAPPELAALLAGAEGQPRAAMEQKMKAALKWTGTKPEHKNLMAQLEMIELNLPNLK